MTAADLVPGVEYFYTYRRAEPEKRVYLMPMPDAKDCYIFRGEKNYVYNLYGPDLFYIFNTEADAWQDLADAFQAAADTCRKKAQQLNQPIDDNSGRKT